MRTIVSERSAVGGQAGSTSGSTIYLDFPDGIKRWELASRARQQAQRLGADNHRYREGVGGETRDAWTVVGSLGPGDRRACDNLRHWIEYSGSPR